MSVAVAEPASVTVGEYLASEELSPSKREYLAGVIYAMAGASEAHNTVESNLNALLHRQLRGHSCQQFGSNMQLRLQQPGGTYFYYPDAMVVCDPTDAGHGWRERPSALFEILSDSTRSIDEREKRLAYLNMPSLEAYVRIEQDRAEVVVERRTENGGWRAERFVGTDATVRFRGALGMVELPLGELYERVMFARGERPALEKPE